MKQKILMILCLLAMEKISAATITTIDGKRFDGKIISEGEKEIVIQGSDGIETRLPKSRVAQVNYQENLPPSKKQYWAVGATFGTPGGLNLNLWYMWSSFGFQLSGGYIGTVYGTQANLAWKIGDYQKFLHTLFVGAGHSSVTTKENNLEITKRWTYGIVGYNLNWYGFFLELGITLGSGDFKSPQFAGQIGYVHRFNSGN